MSPFKTAAYHDEHTLQIKTGMQAANTYNTQTNSKAAQTQITRQTDGRTRRTAKTQAHDIQPET